MTHHTHLDTPTYTYKTNTNANKNIVNKSNSDTVIGHGVYSFVVTGIGPSAGLVVSALEVNKLFFCLAALG